MLCCAKVLIDGSVQTWLLVFSQVTTDNYLINGFARYEQIIETVLPYSKMATVLKKVGEGIELLVYGWRNT